MKKHLSLMLAVCISAGAPPLLARNAMGFLTGSSSTHSPGLYTFDIDTGTSLDNIASIPYFLMGGAYAEKNYWVMLSYDQAGNLGQKFTIIDPATGQELRSTGRNYGCTDMTYDLSTSDLYGILYTRNGSVVPNQLVRISTPSGECTEIATLADRFMTLACDLWGNLYAINSSGVLHRIDKRTGKTTVIGSTGLLASDQEVQSMEFDRDSGSLYWSFLDMDDNTWIARIDPDTGSVIEKHGMQDNALLGALHIPYAEVELTSPGQVTDLDVNVEGDAVSFSWAAPQVALNGNELKGAMTLEIRRDGLPVKTFTGVGPGDAGSWTDTEAPANCDITYAFTCYAGGNRGASRFITVHVGDDVPASVRNVRITADSDGIKLEWDAPETDCNGAPLDISRLSYGITRHPDGVIWENITSTSFSDTGLPQANQYSYTVTPVNHMGAGESSDSETVIAGPALSAPWYPHFGKPEECSQFVVVDANGDNNSWTLNNGAMRFSCMYGAGDDWLITMPVHMEKDMVYNVKCSIRTAGAIWSPENLKITLGTGFDPESQNVRELYNKTSITSASELITSAVQVDETGDYTIGMQCYTGKWEGMYLDICSLEIEPVGAVDLAVESPLEGEFLPELDTPYDYIVTVFNNGTETQTGFDVSLIDDDDNVLASVRSDATVAPQESVRCTVTWIPMSGRVRHIRARVDKEGDVNTVNNVSDPFEVLFLNEGEAIASFGVHDSDPGVMPFCFDDYYSFAESIYTNEELGVDGGMIREISWDFNNPGEPLLDKDIRIYMANTSRSYVMTGYLSENEMICVYDGKASFPVGENRLTVTLDEPFPYAGGNLAVMTRKIKDSETGTRVTWHAQNFPEIPRTAIAVNSSGVVRPEDILVSSMLPCLRLRLDTDGGSTLSGTVSSYGSAVGGARVSIDEKMTDALTDASGRYQFGWLPAGDYTLTVTPADYTCLGATSSIRLDKDEHGVLDINLEARSSGPISGTVTDGNGNPVPEAAVWFNGWESRRAVADAQGRFSFDRIYAVDNATFETYAFGYKSGSMTLDFDADPAHSTVNIDLEAVRNPVETARVSLEGGIPSVDWEPVRFSYDIVADNGNPSGIYETGVYGAYLLAKQFDGPLYIDRIMWHSGTCTSGSVDYVDVHVYALNEMGEPQYLLMSQKGCPNKENSWNELSTVDIPDAPVYSPYGCLVAIGADGPFAISRDDAAVSGSYIIDPARGAYSPLTDGYGHVNLMIRISAAHADPYASPVVPEVTYNVYRLRQEDKDDHDAYVPLGESAVATGPVEDHGWGQLADGDYMYAVEAVYPGGVVTESCLTSALSHSGVNGIHADGIRISVVDGGIIVSCNSDTHVDVFSTSGLHVVSADVSCGQTKVDLESGIYIVHSENGVSRIIVK